MVTNRGRGVGKVALVTGSSRGIGLATAEALAREGFAVAINGPVDDAELQAAVARVAAMGGRVVAAPFDVTDIAGHDAALARIESALGPLTTLVNNAGVGVLQRGDLLDVTEASWDRCLTVNTKAMFFLSQAFARRLLARDRGTAFHSIINVTSANAIAVAVQRAEYCASKAAAAMVSKAMAVRLGAENIAVYDVQPGLIATEMTAPVIASYAKRAAQGLTLFPRVGQPEEMGVIIASLATGRLPYTTGQVISADAGMLVSRF
jgi:3-oxoacyl-[acyl-carrier protein] reductase